MKSKLQIALFLPNLLGYTRIALAFLGLALSTNDAALAVASWILSGFLDLFDGIIARSLGQTSNFGVFLDIAADNILRATVWTAVATQSPSLAPIACSVICLEWTTMVCTQVFAAKSASHWKDSRSEDPALIKFFFRNNFRNPLGMLGIFGLFAANLFLYGRRHPVLYENIPGFTIWMVLACTGRGISAVVEVWLCSSYLHYVLEQDCHAHRE